jgi:phage shock protein A
VADQKVQVESLKSALKKLEHKLDEAQSKSELLLARHRRSRAVSRTADARMAMSGENKIAAFDRMSNKVTRAEAVSLAKAELVGDSLDDRLSKLEKDDQIEQLLLAIKTRKGLTA